MGFLFFAAMVRCTGSFVLIFTIFFIGLCTANHITNIKAINAIADGPAIDVYVNGVRTRTNVQYASVTGYVPLPSGEILVQITRTGVNPNTEVLASQNVDLVGGYITIAAVGSIVNQASFPIQLFVVTDEINIPSEQALLRTLYLSATSTGIDVIANNNQVLWENITFPGTGEPEYLVFSANVPFNVEIQPTRFGSDRPLAGPTILNLPRNSANTIFVIGIMDSQSSPITIVYSKDFVTGQVSPSQTTTRTPSTTQTNSATHSRSFSRTVSRSFNTSASSTVSISETASGTIFQTRTPFRTFLYDDDDGDFTKSATPAVFVSRSSFRTLNPDPSVTTSSTKTPQVFASNAASPFVTRSPDRTISVGYDSNYSQYISSQNGASSLAFSFTLCIMMLLAGLM